ncbi:DNA repair protein RecN [Carboxylicivirga sp. N1Y90]|uniref:DNA repair protein RecN n=1 Tax=Carboxylicivirga fragile TaxID=3417571 RepID=UPI003D328615|nr:DNA repair protein RecN [Marinilabiliaceae bacterium N1Y90]
MLKSLSISNYALIDRIEINFDAGLTVITGETGAGKSVLLGALALILGQRSDLSALLDRDQKCVVEGEFSVEQYGLEATFKEHDVDYESLTIIRREILPSGKSRAFVNDTPVNLAFLKTIGASLIDVHSQHQNLLLDDNGFHRLVIDSVASNRSLLEDYQKIYNEYLTLNKRIEEIVAENNRQKDDLDYMQFQFDQLEEANLKLDEQNELEERLKELSHVEEIKTSLSIVVGGLADESNGVLESLRASLNAINTIQQYLNDGDELAQRINSSYIDLKDLSDDLETRVEDLEYDPVAIHTTQERLDLIYSLQKKHHVDSVEALIDLHGQLQTKINKLNFFDEELKLLQTDLEKLSDQLTKIGKELTKSRLAVFDQVKQTIEKHLIELGMPHANFVIKNEATKSFTLHGMDSIEFLFAANKNGTPSSINKVASGGEMSRVMLSIKALLSSAKGLPTIIFDEIDTGVSGEVADQMGVIMSEMARNMQVVSITHLPQITVKGSEHFKVFKTDSEDKTISQIKKLSKEERVVEVAKMLSGANLTDVALENARMLLNN